MPTLNEYSKEVQVLLREQRQELINPEDIIRFINRARRDIAMRTQCVRILTPITSGIFSASVILSGSGYTGATVGISAPDFPSGVAPNPNGLQATAVANIASGSISSVSITLGGDGYFQPQASIVGDGTGASVTLQTQPINVLKQGQEVYPFSSIVLTSSSTVASDTTAGIAEIYYVKSISIIYANYRYSLPVYPFSTYQSMIREYPFQYQYVPTMASQYGQGSGGSFYVYPLPSQTYQYELDCFGIPKNMTTNTSIEVIPEPWTDAVAYLACAHGMMSMQNYNGAQFYKSWYDEFVQRYSNYARQGRVTNPYGRW